MATSSSPPVIIKAAAVSVWLLLLAIALAIPGERASRWWTLQQELKAAQTRLNDRNARLEMLEVPGSDTNVPGWLISSTIEDGQNRLQSSIVDSLAATSIQLEQLQLMPITSPDAPLVPITLQISAIGSYADLLDWKEQLLRSDPDLALSAFRLEAIGLMRYDESMRLDAEYTLLITPS